MSEPLDLRPLKRRWQRLADSTGDVKIPAALYATYHVLPLVDEIERLHGQLADLRRAAQSQAVRRVVVPTPFASAERKARRKAIIQLRKEVCSTMWEIYQDDKRWGQLWDIAPNEFTALEHQLDALNTLIDGFAPDSELWE